MFKHASHNTVGLDALHVLAGVANEAVLVHDPKVCTSSVVVEAFIHHAADNGLANAQTGASGANANNALVHYGLQRYVAASEGREQPGQSNRARALNIVIEHEVFVAVLAQKLPSVWVGKILKLYKNVGPSVAKGSHHFIHKLKELRVCWARLLQAKVKWVINQLLAIGA
jgi:hypothetical protein